jgi:hypothetical protein
MAACHFVEVTDKEISEIKINSTQKTCAKMHIIAHYNAQKTIIRPRLCDYWGIFTSTSSLHNF